jgi:hypothetical protein
VFHGAATSASRVGDQFEWTPTLDADQRERFEAELGLN